jgi:hypothetical protein
MLLNVELKQQTEKTSRCLNVKVDPLPCALKSKWNDVICRSMQPIQHLDVSNGPKEALNNGILKQLEVLYNMISFGVVTIPTPSKASRSKI